MKKFDFVSGDDFRVALESDYQELITCLDNQAWKAAHVLSGSIIEAILIDYLVATKSAVQGSSDPLRLDLHQAITACREEGIITQRAADLSSVVRTYRNLIHPGRIIRLQEKVDENSARVAHALVDIVISEISANKQTKYGYTAEQLTSKIERDASAIAILGHLLKETNEFEMERILVSVIPQKAIDLLVLAIDQSEVTHEHERVLKHLEECYHVVMEGVSIETKKKAVIKIVETIKSESGAVVSVYDRYFFRAEYLKFIDNDDAELVKRHILKTFNQFSYDTLRALEGIGKHLNSLEAVDFADIIVRTLINDPFYQNEINQFVHSEYYSAPRDVVVKFDARLKSWEQQFMHRQPSKAQLLTNLIADLEIPF